MAVQFNFPSTAWATETITGPWLATLFSIADTQYLTFRLRGDPAFASSDFHNLYLYAYDANNNFGRWGVETPANADWEIVNLPVKNIEQPWNSPGLPDLSQIMQFAFYQYGSQAAIAPYTATILIDDLMLRDTPLTEFSPPSAPRELIDDFEGYAAAGALTNFYNYQNSPATTLTTASLETPAPRAARR